MRTRAYIDGFNVYHGIDKYIKDNNINKSFSWVNPKMIITHFLSPKDKLEEVYFFSAIPKHKGKGKIQRHKNYYSVLENYCNIKIVDGFFSKKIKNIKCGCRDCQKYFSYKLWEEKKTDVSLGIQAIKDVFTNNVDKIIILSADSDFIPVVEMVLNDTNIKVHVLRPLGQMHNYNYTQKYLTSNNNYSFSELKGMHYKTSYLGDIVIDKNGHEHKNPYI